MRASKSPAPSLSSSASTWRRSTCACSAWTRPGGSRSGRPGEQTRFDALPEYWASPLFTQAEKAALDYAAALTQSQAVSPSTFARLREFYSERKICDIVWLVASEYIYIQRDQPGLGIGSDGLCELSDQGTKKRPKPSRGGEHPSSAASR